MCFLVNASMNNLQSELVNTLYREQQFGVLLTESDDMAQVIDTHACTDNMHWALQRDNP